MGKTIWFINDYAGSRYHGMEFRNYYFAKEFVKLGYKVYIITASYMHLFKKFPEIEGNFTFEEIDGINYIWVKVPKYGESNDKKRVLKWFIFTAKLFFLPISKMDKPDFVIASPMATFLTIPAYYLAKKFKAKFVFEVKDIWPLSIVELGNINPKNPLIRAMNWCEKFAIKKADLIVSSLQNYSEHLREDLGIKKDFLWVNNGVDLDEMKNIEPLPKEIEQQIPKDKFIIGYTGTIGIANMVENLCRAAQKLKDRKDIHFVIVGSGKYKDNLVEKYGKLDNILFIDPIPKNQVQSMLKLFDVCYIGLKKERLFKYGVSPNKLFDYMLSKKPILYAIDSGKSNIVDTAKCGISIEPDSIDSIIKGIIELYTLPTTDREKLGQNGKEYVLNNFTYSSLAERFIENLEKIN